MTITELRNPLGGGDVVRTARRITCAAVAAAWLTSAAIAAPPRFPDALHTTTAAQDGALAAIDAAIGDLVNETVGLIDGTLVMLDRAPTPGRAFTMPLPFEGHTYELEFVPFDVRAEHYRLLAQVEDGSTVESPRRANVTFRGAVRGMAGSVVTGAVLDAGLHAMVQLPDGDRLWMQPVDDLVPLVPDHTVVVYRSTDVVPAGATCGMSDAAAVDHFGGADDRAFGRETDGGTIAFAGAGGPCVAELACDADYEYFQAQGSSVANTEARITAIINTVNVQYESQVGLTHAITTILVRSAEPDPYTQSDSADLLCAFITEWSNNQGGVQRDVAHLFTGRDLTGQVIGQAADLGDICNSQGCCSCGEFGTDGSYCIAQSDYNGVFSCATDLTAHELGHLWNASHCSCSGNTMNSGITCANSFSAATIADIIAYRDTVKCLDGTCEAPAGGDTDDCAGAQSVACNSSTQFNNAGTTPPAGGGDDPDLPPGSPSCQWSADPDDTHNTVWYSFVAGDTSVEIQTCSNGTTIQDTIVALFSGTCGALTELACGEDECGASGYLSRICYDGLTPGQTYLVMVGNPGSWPGSFPGPIQLDIACPCPDLAPPDGACCLIDGSCTVLTEANCDAFGGSIYQGDDSTCSQVFCPQPLGACCLGAGACTLVSESVCNSVQGDYQGDFTACQTADCPLPNGRCCLPDGTCQDVDGAECSTIGGQYDGDGTKCAGAPCPAPGGACCRTDGSCFETNPDLCVVASGTYQGDFTVCATSNCPQPEGACCFFDGSCLELTEANCLTVNGAYQGDGTLCTQVSCPQPLGACCRPDGSCQDATETECTTIEGSYGGDFSDCAGTECPQPLGACCFADGSCLDQTAADCAFFSGAYQGNFTDCANSFCPPADGACCRPDGSCVETTQDDCEANGGAYDGPLTICAVTECPQPQGSCCFFDGSCLDLTAVDCTFFDGVYSGDGTKCASTDCPPPSGACCVADGTCTFVQETLCLIAGGTYQGPLVECSEVECPQPCPGDLDGDDQVAFTDLVILLQDWGVCPGCDADLDGDDLVGFTDLIELLAAWGPCP